MEYELIQNALYPDDFTTVCKNCGCLINGADKNKEGQHEICEKTNF